MNARELRGRLTRAYDLISAIPVAGENADRMAAARNELKAAYRLVGPEHEYDVRTPPPPGGEAREAGEHDGRTPRAREDDAEEGGEESG